jgi:uncharacterized membrane protein YidH (DUF202 family)
VSDDADWDKGRASDRTVLAWQRTALASLAVAALALRAGVVDHSLGLAIPVAAMLAIAAAAEWRFGTLLYRERRRADTPRMPLHRRALLAIAAVTCFSAAGSIAIAVAS